MQHTRQLQVPRVNLVQWDQVTLPLLQPQFRFLDLEPLQLFLTIEFGTRLDRILVPQVRQHRNAQVKPTVFPRPQKAVTLDIGYLHPRHTKKRRKFRSRDQRLEQPANVGFYVPFDPRNHHTFSHLRSTDAICVVV